MKSVKLLALLLTAQLIYSFAALARPVTSASSATTVPVATKSAPLNLNLSSKQANISAATLALSKSLSITVGGVSQAITSASFLTPAEYVAAYEVSSLGRQTLTVNSQGVASGGRFSLVGALAQSIGNLVVPQNVKLVENFGLMPVLDLSGNLIDAGRIIAFSTSSGTTDATLNANNISVLYGGVITSILSNSMSQKTVSGLSLNLNALGNVLNAGTITSAGNLNVTAGGSITNALPSGSSGIAQASPSMQAANSLNLLAGTGNFVNSGLISALSGNVSVGTSQLGQNISFNNSSGIVQALGAINVREAGYAGSGNLTLTAGNWLSQQVNLYSGTGTVAIDVGQLTGVVNTYAGSAHISAQTADLNIGFFSVTGDPFVSNNGGNLDLSSQVTFPTSYLVATAGGSIYTSSSSTNINTSSTSQSGGNVVLVAGVTSTDTSDVITLNRSSTGGDIYLVAGGTFDSKSTNDITGFNTSTSLINSNGGNVTLVAMTNGVTGSNTGGHVFLPAAVEIDTEGAGNGTNGNVTIIAEASAGTSNTISIGNIGNLSTFWGTGTGGNVNIKVATPNLSGVSINDLTGAVSGNFDNGSLTLRNGAIAIGSIVTSGATGATPSVGTVTIATNNSIMTQNINTSGAFGGANQFLTAGTNVATGDLSSNNLDTIAHGYSGGAVTINAGGTITTGGIDTDSNTGASAGRGGSVNITSTGTTSTSGAITIGDVANALGINTAGDHGGGAVNITSTGGSITLTEGVATNNTDVANGTDSPTSGGNVTIKSGVGQVAGNTITIDANTTTGIPIDTNSDTQKSAGSGGSVTLTSTGSTATAGAIQVNGDIYTWGDAGGGAVTITSTAGTISLQNIWASVQVGGSSGGNVSITSGVAVPGSTITVLYIDTDAGPAATGATGHGGSVTITSTGTTPTSGAISVGLIDTYGIYGGGAVTITSTGGSITTQDIYTANVDTSIGGAAGGNVSITSGVGQAGSTITVGTVPTTGPDTGAIDTDSYDGGSSGLGGSVTLKSTGTTATGGAITVNDYIYSAGDLGGGAVTITSSGGSITVPSISTYNADSSGGGKSGGNVSIKSGVGAVAGSTISVGAIDTDSYTGSSAGPGGSVTLISTGATATAGAITVSGAINTYGDLGGGAVTITSTGGSVSAQTISTYNADLSGAGASGGAVTITSGTSGTGAVAGSSITVGAIDSDSNTFASAGHGGSVTLTSTGATSGIITANGVIDTAGDLGGGAVNITSTGGSITAQDIVTNNNDTAAGGASGGSVTIVSGVGQVVGGPITIGTAPPSTGTDQGAIDTDSNTGGSSGHGGSVTVTSTGTTATSGEITVKDFINTAGDLGGGAVTITSTGGSIAALNISTNNSDTSGAGAAGGSVSITTGSGAVAGSTISVGTIDTDSLTTGSAGLGGNVTITSNGTTAAGGAIIVANVIASGDLGGGAIVIKSNTTPLFEIGNVAATNGVTGMLTSEGGDGGSITVYNFGSGGITLDSQSDVSIANGTSNSGGTLDLDSSGFLSGVRVGAGGVLTIPSGTYSADATGSGLFGGSVQFWAQSVVLTGGSSIAMSAIAQQGAGGFLAFGLFGTGNNVTVGSGGLITQMSATGATGGGSIDVATVGNLTLKAQSAVAYGPGANGYGGSLLLSSTGFVSGLGTGGVLTLPSGTYSANATGNGQFAGGIDLSGNSIVQSGTTGIVLTANDTKGQAGFLTVSEAAATSNLTIGSGGLITQMSATGLAGQGGQIEVSVNANSFGTTPVLNVTGTVTTSGSLFLFANGNMTLGGTESAATALTAQTTANNGGISIAGKVGLAGSTVNLQTVGTGSITGTTAGMLTASALNLITVNGGIGTSTASLLKTTAGTTISFNATGNVFIANTGTTRLVALPTLSALSAATLDVTSTLALTIGNAISASTATLTATAGGITVNAPVMTSSGALLLTATAGNIGIGAAVSSASTMTLKAAATTGAITDTNGSLITATALTLLTGGGSAGSSTAFLPTSVSSIVTTLSGTTSTAYIQQSGAVTLGATTAGAGFTLDASGNIANSGAVSSSAITLNSTGGSIALGAALGKAAANVSLRIVSGNGSITDTTTAAKITAGTLSLSTAGGNIGTSTLSTLLTAATTLSVGVNGTPSQVFIGNAANVTITGATASNSFYLNNTGTITIASGASTISAPAMTLQSSTNIIVNGTVGSLTNPLTLKAGTTGTGTITAGSQGAVDASSLTLIGGNMGTSSNVMLPIDAGALTVTSAGAVYLNDSTAVTLNTCSGGATFSLTASGTITTRANDFVSATAVTLHAVSGGIVLGDNVGKTGGTTTFITAGTGTIQASTFSVLGTTVNLTTAGGNISGGSGPNSNSLQTSATTLTINTGSNSAGTVDVNNTVAVKLAASTAGTVDLTASGTITVGGALNASGITLQTTANNGGIAIGANVGTSLVTNNTELETIGSGAITQTAGLVYGQTSITLSTGTNGFGNIGASATASIKLSTSGTITSTTGTNGGSGSSLKLGATYLSNAISGATLAASSQSGGTFSLTANGFLTVDGISTLAPTTTSSGAVTIIAGGTLGGELEINGNVIASGGSITIENSNITASTNSSIVINAGVDIHASSTVTTAGQVNIVMGAVPTTPVNTSGPANVSVSGSGKVYFGSHGITTDGSGNILAQADSRNIVFNTGLLGASAILVHAGTGSPNQTTITADPPPVNAPQITTPAASGASTSTVNSNPSLTRAVLVSNTITSASTMVGSIPLGENLISQPIILESVAMNGLAAEVICTSENHAVPIGHSSTIDDADHVVDTGDYVFPEEDASVATAK